MKNRKNLLEYLLLLSLILGVHKGRIALLDAQSREPIRVFPYSVSALPTQDQLLLKAGIPIESESELHRLLQDYLS